MEITSQAEEDIINELLPGNKINYYLHFFFVYENMQVLRSLDVLGKTPPPFP